MAKASFELSREVIELSGIFSFDALLSEGCKAIQGKVNMPR